MTTRTAVTLLALATFTMSGCSSTPREWYKEGIQPDDTQTALSECRYQVGLNKIPKGEQEELVKNCMEGKGFRLR